MSSERKYAVLAVVATLAVAVLDLFLPQQIETNFFFIAPLLLSQRAYDVRLAWGIAGFVAVWTVFINVSGAGTISGTADLNEWINDVLGVSAILVIAFFISSRTKAEADLNAIIDFVDGRLALPEDNLRLRRRK